MPRRPHQPVRAALVATSLVCTSLLAACGLFGDEDPAPRRAAGSTTTTTAVPALEVLDAGATPRQVLELQFREGATTTLAMTVDLAITQRAGSAGDPVELDPPAVTQTVRFTVGEVRADDADVALEFVDVTVDRRGTSLTDQELAELTDRLRQLVGLRGTGRITNHGRLLDLTYDRPDHLDPAVAASLDDLEGQLDALAVPLPRTAVGVGARWRVRARTSFSGVEVEQATTYELTALRGSVITYRADLTQRSGAQTLELDGLPTGTTARLVSGEASGAAGGTMDLSSLVATSATALSGTQVVALRSGSDIPTELTQDLEVRSSVRPVG